MKRFAVIVLCASMLSGCTTQGMTGVATSSNAEDIKVNQVSIDGTILTVPFEFSEMERVGYKMTDVEFAEISPNQTCVAYFEDEDGNKLITSLGTKTEATPVEEAMVVDILADTMNTDTTDMKIFGGINFNSSIEEIEKVFGEPSYELENSLLYTKHIGDVDMACVAIMNGEIIRIETCVSEEYYE